MDKHNEESGCYNKIHYSDIPCAKCGEKKIPLGQESACEMNGKYYFPNVFMILTQMKYEKKWIDYRQ